MTPETLAHTLRRMAGHINHLRDAIRDQPLRAPRYSQTDSHQSHGGPKSPTNDHDLDYLNDVQDRLREITCNVSEDLALVIPHNVHAHGHWTAWLYRNRAHLPQLSWFDDLADNLTDIETELRVKIHPTDPHEIKLPDYATAEEIARAHNITPRAVRKYCQKHHITKWQIEGQTTYSTQAFNKARQ